MVKRLIYPPMWLAFGLFRLQDALGNFDFMALFRATAIPSQMNASIQQPNESGGLLIVAVWMAFLAWKCSSDAAPAPASP